MSIVSFDKYIEDSKRANTHPAKLLTLSDMLKHVFGVEIQDLIPGIETKLGSKVLGVRGSADLMFSNVVFEIKVDLKREEDDAKEKLIKYFQALYEKNPGVRFVGVATDCIAFKAYLPLVKNQVVVDVREISSIDLSTVSVTESILWLDSFIFSKPKIRPTAEDLKWRFGPGSPTYSLTVDGFHSLWSEVRDEKDAKLKLNLWARNMEIVYGSKPEEKSFLAHTYLVSLVKLIVYLRLSGDNAAREEKIKSALTGEYFSSYGITNLIEEDYFAWLLHPKVVGETLSLCCGLVNELLRYDFSQIDEDFFKEIYQEIVERGERHRIGEYYTPEWLAELTLQEALPAWREGQGKTLPRILDPFCGSGTFLCNAVRWMKNELMGAGTPIDQALDTILNSIVGMDINPLAVTIARANYLIALGDLLKAGKTIVIPVYVSDSIKIAKVETIWEYHANERVEVYDIEVNNFHIQIPEKVAKDRPTLGRVLEGFRGAVEVYRARKNKDEAYKAFKKDVANLLSLGEFEVFKVTLDAILGLIDKRQDAIWIFLISNMYAPVALMEAKFDILVGNPPWIAMRYVENKSYQDFLKEQVLSYRLLKSDQVQLFTHMEVATLCYCRAADLYLKNQGVIAFVMPRSVLTGAFHHESFRLLKEPKMKLIKILDMEDVSLLFNVPSCVLIAAKGESTSYPVFARRYTGTLERKNSRLSEATNSLTVSDYMYEPPKALVKHSYYHDRVKQGATIVPRSVWFVDFEVQPTLGVIDTGKPRVKTSKEIKVVAKKPWTDIELKGNIEAEFIYGTILGGEIIPFSYLKMRPIAIPAEPLATGYKLLDVKELRNRGAVHMADWLEKAQAIWEKLATERSIRDYPRLITWLDYLGKLTQQNPRSRYVVLYNTSGTNLVSCVVRKESLPEFNLNGAKIKPKNFVAESTTYFYETEDETEAHYICAILNSPMINNTIKPLQPRGLWGERHIHRRPFMLPVPRFDKSNSHHIRLAELSMKCYAKVSSLKLTKTTSAGARQETKEAVSEELKEIDIITSKLLGL
ncbi:MAG: N-6 DNA methylase [Nitrososphaerales archaeon]